jgi:hypothetical protein
VTVKADARIVGDGLGQGARLVAIGGRSASPELAAKLGAEVLDCDPVTAAARVAAEAQ